MHNTLENREASTESLGDSPSAAQAEKCTNSVANSELVKKLDKELFRLSRSMASLADLQILFPDFLRGHLSWLGQVLKLTSSKQLLTKQPTIRPASTAVSEIPATPSRSLMPEITKVSPAESHGSTFRLSSPTSGEQEIDASDLSNLSSGDTGKLGGDEEEDKIQMILTKIHSKT